MVRNGFRNHPQWFNVLMFHGDWQKVKVLTPTCTKVQKKKHPTTGPTVLRNPPFKLIVGLQDGPKRRARPEARHFRFRFWGAQWELRFRLPMMPLVARSLARSLADGGRWCLDSGGTWRLLLNLQKVLGVDSLSIIFIHRSDCFPWKRRISEQMRKCPLLQSTQT